MYNKKIRNELNRFGVIAMPSDKLYPCFSYPGYSITEDGRIWNDGLGRTCNEKQSGGHWMYPRLNSCGYAVISLCSVECKAIHGRSIQVGRFLLDAFVGECPPGQECRHLDGNKLNNVLSNLAWGTQQENGWDSTRYGAHKRGEKHHSAKLTNQQVIEIKQRLDNDEVQAALAREFNVRASIISNIYRKRARIIKEPVYAAEDVGEPSNYFEDLH